MTSTSIQGVGSGAETADLVTAIAADLDRMRRRTLALVDSLPDEVLGRQMREFMSPLLWDLGHIADFERLWLIDAVQGQMEGALETRFDAQATPRSRRGGIALPSRQEAMAILADVRARVLRLLPAAPMDGRDRLLRGGYVYRMVLQHEAQHQETMLQALDLAEVAIEGLERRADGAAPGMDVDDEARVVIPAGAFAMGTDDRGAAYDNERPRHRVDVGAFAIERYPTSNRRWRAFMDGGGYQTRELWSEAGWAWLQQEAPRAPNGWARDGAGWRLRRFGTVGDVDPAEPVQHVGFWEAEAFARWCGGRLPTEHEWEKAAGGAPPAETLSLAPTGDDGRAAGTDPLVGAGHWGPPRLGTGSVASGYGVEDLLGSVYQWTSSTFLPYPGFEAFPYREYSEVFFGDRYRVLRGSSWAADIALRRRTYRNWDLPQRRQLFAGVRVAYDI